MTNVAMTMHTRLHIATIGARQQRMHEVCVTVDAGSLGDSLVTWFDLDRVFKFARRERQRMKEPVVRLGDPFTKEVMGQMTIVANGHMVMAALLPGIHVALHHVTVHARIRMIT